MSAEIDTDPTDATDAADPTATEGSTGSTAAAEPAAGATADGDRVGSVFDATESWDMVVERRERTGEEFVEVAEATGAARGVDVEKWFRYGTLHEEAVDFAAAHDADLVVVGSACRTGRDRLIHPDPLPTRV